MVGCWQVSLDPTRGLAATYIGKGGRHCEVGFLSVLGSVCTRAFCQQRCGQTEALNVCPGFYGGILPTHYKRVHCSGQILRSGDCLRDSRIFVLLSCATTRIWASVSWRVVLGCARAYVLRS